jgi:cytochrome P450/acyl-CoA synthetase (AMP-forming)/AMP-acid ligase II
VFAEERSAQTLPTVEAETSGSSYADPGALSVAEYVLGRSVAADRLAVVDHSRGGRPREWSYVALTSAVSHLATRLSVLGIGEGDVVAVLTETSAEFVIAYYGVLAAGAVVLPLDPRDSEASWAADLAGCHARAIIVEAALWATPPRLLNGVVHIGSDEAAPREDSTPWPEAIGANHGQAGGRGLTGLAPGGDRPAVLMSSSGTQGLPKKVVVTHRNLTAGLAQIATVHRIGDGEAVTCVGPLRHVYGMQMAMNPVLRGGGTLVITTARFHLADFLTHVREHHVAVAYLVPSVVVELAARTSPPLLPDLRLIVSGGGPLPPFAAADCARRVGVPVVQGFGMTEAGCVSFTPDDRPGPVGSIGVVLPGTETRFVNPETGRASSSGEAGELWLRGPQLTPGYLPGPATSAAPVRDPDGWFHTGDLAALDPGGYLRIVGRLKSLIKYKGHQVPPAELEAILLTHPAVEDTLVVGEPDDAAGELPKAFVVVPATTPLSDITAYVTTRVAPHKRIRRIERVREISRSAMGKPLRPAALRVIVTDGYPGFGRDIGLALIRAGASVLITGGDQAAVDDAVRQLDGIDVLIDTTTVPGASRAGDLAQTVLPGMLAAGWGRIIIVGDEDTLAHDMERVVALNAELTGTGVSAVAYAADSVSSAIQPLLAIATGAADHLSGTCVTVVSRDPDRLTFAGVENHTTPEDSEEPSILSYPFNKAESLAVSEMYERVRGSRTLPRVRLPFGEPAWLITDYEQARFVLSDPRFSRAAAHGRDIPRQSHSPMDAGLLSIDPPDHTRLRSLISKAFTMRRVEGLRPKVRALAETLIEEMKSSGTSADLVEQYALPLTRGVISDLLGVPKEDRGRFRAWSDAHLSTNALPAAEIATRTGDLHAYIAELTAAKRAKPADDLLSDLVEARDQDDRLSEEELVKVAITLLSAGYEATSTQIPNFIYFLLGQPELWNQLRTQPEKIPSAVEELLRFVPLMAGAGTMPRYALAEVMIGETVVAAGEPVIVSLTASNRDSALFENPDTFAIDRERNRHLAFGHGLHHCVGMSLARIELQESLAAVLHALPDLRLTGEIAWKKKIMRGPETMWVSW